MATRTSIDELLTKCEQAIEYAEHEYEQGAMQEHYNSEEFSQVQQLLEQRFQDLIKMENSSSPQQKEQMYRMRLRLQDIQNDLILLRR
ncbi:DUF2524 family protein [Bacillus carboniphilus]|uniref:DUF2524 family protein n=1 Tax=Bacillus carboniphilus TaxID=86663 RepID=A0ABY9JP33_9BACI|nr:DUF2524 family protein [Bacillus carboniphilus]WLR41170.1 DUF2524 family protein [Bacillus carboniphilus]